MRFRHQSSDPSFVKPGEKAQAAHDALLAVMPEGAEHAKCDLCPDPGAIKEVAKVADNDRTYTEAEHLALAADAVKRETAELSTAKESAETKVTDLTSKVDVLESEKATLQSEKDTAEKALEDYKAEIERAKEVEAAKASRKEKVEKANDALDDSYFTDERVQRWAEMTEEAFASFLEDITGVKVTPAKETAAFGEGSSPTSKGDKPSVGRLLAARSGQ